MNKNPYQSHYFTPAVTFPYNKDNLEIITIGFLNLVAVEYSLFGYCRDKLIPSYAYILKDRVNYRSFDNYF